MFYSTSGIGKGTHRRVLMFGSRITVTPFNSESKWAWLMADMQCLLYAWTATAFVGMVLAALTYKLIGFDLFAVIREVRSAVLPPLDRPQQQVSLLASLQHQALSPFSYVDGIHVLWVPAAHSVTFQASNVNCKQVTKKHLPRADSPPLGLVFRPFLSTCLKMV